MNLVIRKVKILVYSLVICAVLFGSLGFVYTYRSFHPKAQKPVFFCGTVSLPRLDTVNTIHQKQAEQTLGFAFDPGQGEKLFKANCNSCHVLGRDMTGPNLMGINERVSFDWALSFVQNPRALKEADDPYTLELLNVWEEKSGLHPPQPLSEEELHNVLGYLELWTPPTYIY